MYQYMGWGGVPCGRTPLTTQMGAKKETKRDEENLGSSDSGVATNYVAGTMDSSYCSSR